MQDNEPCFVFHLPASARLAQSAERKALNLVVVGSSPMVGASVQKHKSLTAGLDMPGLKPMDPARCKP